MAFQDFPSFNFNESNVGPRPVRSASVDTIGMVGQFARGPLTPQIVDADDAHNLFGFTTDVGSVHLQVMNDQGADSFLITRVLGSATAAFLDVVTTGTVSGAGTLNVSVKSGATTIVCPVTLTDTMGSTALNAAIISAVNSTSGQVFVTATAGITNQVVFTDKTAGAAGNTVQIKYALVTSTGPVFAPSGITAFTNLAGGADAPMPAVLTVLDGTSAPVFTLNAAWPGATGNNIFAKITAGSDTGKFTLTLSYSAEAITEVFNDFDLTDLYQEDQLNFLRSSLLARGTLVDGTKTPALLGSTPLASGGDGPAVTTSDFTAAIALMHDFSCTIICCPGVKPNGVDQNAINAALTAQAEAIDVEMGEMFGLRNAVISAPRGTVIADIANLKTAGSIPDSKRTVMVMGWSTYGKVANFKRFGIDPAALYAAHLLVTPAQVSPAARTSSPPLVGITEVDTPPGNSAWNTITQARMDAIILDPFGGFRCLNGRSTSSDPAWYWICFRRVYDKIRTDIFSNFQFIKSEPSNSALDAVVQDTANGYLVTQMNDRVIAGYNPTVSNGTNNPPATRAAGKRYVDIGIELIPPNDFTQFNLNRVVTASIRLA